MIEEKVGLELKVVDTIAPIHEAQLLTYLKLSGMKVGSIINSNVPVLKNGVKMLVF
ncbi:MAG: GxxExxY protein [bacterium]